MKKVRRGRGPRHEVSFEDRMSMSLEELEGDYWSGPTSPTTLVASVHRMRKLPLRDLRTEDLRVAIGQEVGLAHLVPLALATLEQDPFAEGDYYPGDLLSAVANKVGPSFWREEQDLAQRFRRILEQSLARISEAEPPPSLASDLRYALERLP